MKSIVTVLMSLLLATTCHTKKEKSDIANTAIEVVKNDTTPEKMQAEQVDAVKDSQKNVQEQTNMATYEAFSRGLFLKIVFSNNQVIVFQDRNNNAKGNPLNLNTTQISELNALLNEINPKEIQGLKAPTDKRLYDGAAHASLTITANGVTYVSSGFDHGAPPAAIEKFVSKLVGYTQDK